VTHEEEEAKPVPVPDPSETPLAELVSLAGRRAVVTGGGRGFGRGIARRLAEAGASVLVGDLDEEGARDTATEVATTYGVTAIATGLDVADSASITATADTAVDELGGIDIWVNNAGVFPSTPVLDLTDEQWDHVLDVNLRGTFIGAREAARRMIAAGHGGVIVNLSSRAGMRGSGAGIPHYAASKFGVRGLTEQLALEFAEHNIRVLAIAPTRMPTPGVLAATAALDPEAAARGRPLDLPLGRPGAVDDVARVVLFCASDLALFMTGSTLLVDGGELSR
jgi:NAD(P)-dependent dehydrogenase (short-subunit alcohol dehydrogenase family)